MRGQGHAERLGRLEVDDQLELHRLLQGQIRWFDAIEHAVASGAMLLQLSHIEHRHRLQKALEREFPQGLGL